MFTFLHERRFLNSYVTLLHATRRHLRRRLESCARLVSIDDGGLPSMNFSPFYHKRTQRPRATTAFSSSLRSRGRSCVEKAPRFTHHLGHVRVLRQSRAVVCVPRTKMSAACPPLVSLSTKKYRTESRTTPLRSRYRITVSVKYWSEQPFYLRREISSKCF